MSTRLPSIFIPACSFPEATMAGVMGSEGLMDATSKAGVCPSSDPAANKVATLMDENIFLGTAIYLAVKALSDIWVGDCKRAATGGRLQTSGDRWEIANERRPVGHWTQPESGFSRTKSKTTAVIAGYRWDFTHFAVAPIVQVFTRCDSPIPGLGWAVAWLRWP